MPNNVVMLYVINLRKIHEGLEVMMDFVIMLAVVSSSFIVLYFLLGDTQKIFGNRNKIHHIYYDLLAFARDFIPVNLRMN